MKKFCGFIWSIVVSISIATFFSSTVLVVVKILVDMLADKWEESIGYRLWPLAFFLSACVVGGIVYVYGQRLFAGKKTETNR